MTDDPAPADRPLTRRRFLEDGAAAALAALAVACRPEPTPEVATVPTPLPAGGTAHAAEGRLVARPGTPTTTATPGLHTLRLGPGRDALLYVPTGYAAAPAAPLAVMLHGAGGTAEHAMSLLRASADAAGLVLLAPPSRAPTWDVLRGGFGPDVAFIDAALAELFGRCAIDPTRVAVGGFSDGASYALSLGITNGDLFTHLIAFSPGFMAPARQEGAPRVYVSHGTRDAVLPIDRCSRRLVPQLERAGYSVRYREFDGPHTVPADIAREAGEWLVG